MTKCRTLLPLAGLLLLLAGGALWFFCPKPALYTQGFSTAVVARDGQLLRLTTAPDGRYRLFTPLKDIAPVAVESTLLYEDQWFFWHFGINPVQLVHAAWTTYLAQHRRSGGSTLTMQLARLRFGIDSSTIPGKIEQILRALQLEWFYSKNQILEAYLNLAPYGGNIEGIGTASLVYFDKPASALTPSEAMTLAVIPQNPNARRPRPDGEPKALAAARKRLLQIWREKRPDTPNLPTRITHRQTIHTRRDLPFLAPHFVRMVLEQHSQGDSHIKSRGGPQGGWIRTTLSLPMQKMAEQKVSDFVASHRHLGIKNAAVLILDTRQTAVRALVGSADWFDDAIDGQVNGVTAKRSPGSAMKPFIYALGLQQGLIQPMTLMKDAPTHFGSWAPDDFDHGFEGPILARDALVYSRNVPAVDLASELKHPDFYTFLQQAGLHYMAPANHYGLALALGGFDITMLKMTAMYAALANGGVLRQPALVRQEAHSRPGTALLTPAASFITLQMLSRNPRPDSPAESASSAQPWVAWKTGTSSGFRDAWSIGVVGHYVVAVWVGNFDGRGNSALIGRQAAGPLLFSIIDALVARHPDAGRAPVAPKTLNVRRVPMCSATGGLPGRYCPHTEKAWFIPGVSPITVSHVFRRIRIDPKTGLRLCPGMDGPAIKRVYEFWPSDLLALFRKAGLPRRTPPPYMPGCNLMHTAAGGVPPRIQTPQANLVYALRADRMGTHEIPFQATTDSDVKTVFWFVNQQFVGTSTPPAPLLWHPRPGIFRVRAVDDMGRADSVILHIRLLPQAG